MSSGLWDLLIQFLCGNVGILSCLLECGYHLTGLMCAEHQTWGKKGGILFSPQPQTESFKLKQDCRSGTKDKHSIRSERSPKIRMNTASV